MRAKLKADRSIKQIHISSIEMLLKKPILSSWVEKPPIATVDIA
jgi:hypothetical protein